MAGKQYRYFIYYMYLFKGDRQTAYYGNIVITIPYKIKDYATLSTAEADVLRDIRKRTPDICDVIIANFKCLGSVADDNT